MFGSQSKASPISGSELDDDKEGSVSKGKQGFEWPSLESPNCAFNQLFAVK